MFALVKVVCVVCGVRPAITAESKRLSTRISTPTDMMGHNVVFGTVWMDSGK